MDYGDHRLFLYDNTVDLVVTTNSLYLDNRPMNNRKLHAHKGLTNTIIFNVRDRDRKLQDLADSELVAYLINPSTRSRLLTKRLHNTEDTGLVLLYLTEGDLQNIFPGLYTMVVTIVDQIHGATPVYTNQNNDVRFDIEISDQALIDPVETQVDTEFTQVSGDDFGTDQNIFASSALLGNLERNFQNAQHSIAVYTDNYTGNIKIQASCILVTPSSNSNSKDWFDIETIPLENFSGITHRTFVVNANWIRVLSFPADETSTITQVLLRN
jgi:hypothetical protein